MEVPDDFEVVINTNEELNMKGDGMSLFMNIFEEDISLDEMDEAVITGAKSINMEEIDAAIPISGNGLDGYYVEGYKDGSRIIFSSMIDPKSHTNFILGIVFNDEDPIAETEAVRIINSVRSLN